MSKRPRTDVLEERSDVQPKCVSESPLLLPSSDLSEKIDVPSASRANPDPSASSTSVIGNNYHVFLSFRGPDTRKGFVDHLYQRLKDVGLKYHPNFVFRDDENLPFGEDVAANLISAIERSKVSIPVISENYAASEWCLRELIHIMECKESRGQIVLPVLYKVEPKDVKYLKGNVEKAFESRRYWSNEAVKQQGREALKKVAESRVFESEKFADGREGELVNKLVEIIMREQQHDFQPHLPANLVGIEDCVAEVMKLVDIACPGTRIIVIWGMGGIGKTTLARNIYKKLFDEFKCRSFLPDIRETTKNKGMEHVQSLLISDITKSSESRVRDPETGIDMIRSCCDEQKVLILLDDIDCQYHLDKLIRGCKFKSGSRIIITCRDMTPLDPEYKRYELKEMNCKDSMLLFRQYAFKGEQPPTDLAALSNDIVATTGGLPLALMVIGSYLNKYKDPPVWKGTLEKLRNAPDKTVQEKLRISYDTLTYEEKQIFLDIACFFIGTDKRIATYLWEVLNFFPMTGLQVLINRSLIKIDDENRLEMHDQLRDLGRVIARPKEEPFWHWSRMWDEEAIQVLRRTKENSYIKALRLDKNGSNVFMKSKSFKRMPYLVFLRLSEVDFVGDFEDSLSDLRWLEWEKSPDSFKATNVHLEKLLILDLSYGYISHEWSGWSSIKMERLKVLNLSRCSRLKSTPDLSVFKSLEMLILELCENLEEIDPSIGDVECLTSLNLSGCHNLKKLPSQLGELKGLVSLNLSSCSRLRELPEEIGKLEKLKELTIDGVSIKEIPSSIGFLKNLEILNAQGCDSLVELPNSIGKLVNLLTLDLRFCYKLKGFPESIGSLVKLQCLLLGNIPPPSFEGHMDSWDYSDQFCFDHIPHSIGKLESLTELQLTCAKISELPESIGELRKLKILKISRCVELSSLPSTISKLGKLEELDAIHCDSLEGEVPINGLSSLKILRLGKISDEVNIFADHMYQERPSLEDFSDLSQQHLDLTNCDLPVSLTVLEVTCDDPTLPELSHLSHLEELNLQLCEFLESIPVLPLGILRLWVFWCGELKVLPNLSSLKLLSELRIVGCSELEEIRGLEGLKSLRLLCICGCKKLSNLKGLEQLESLRDLEMMELDAPLMNDDLSQVQCLGRSKNFESLRIDSCQSLVRLDISQLTHLQVLWVLECENIVEIKCLERRLEKLRSLNIVYCNSIETLPDLSLFDNLEELYVNECPKLHDVEGQVKRVTWFEGGKSFGRSGLNLRRSGNQGV